MVVRVPAGLPQLVPTADMFFSTEPAKHFGENCKSGQYVIRIVHAALES